jgi:hypothetical protein
MPYFDYGNIHLLNFHIDSHDVLANNVIPKGIKFFSYLVISYKVIQKSDKKK